MGLVSPGRREEGQSLVQSGTAFNHNSEVLRREEQ